jgi:Predicted membrane protein (DUF2207)
MITLAAEVTSGAWLALVVLTALGTRWWRPAPGPASLALRGEPPAVVSLLARRLPRDGYPATLLDLAARGWIVLSEAEPGRVMCRSAEGRSGDPGLTDYERRALAHLESRAAGLGAVPGTALDSGFEADEDEFRQLFRDEVQADARARGLLRSRIGRGTLALLVTAGTAGLVLTDVALTEHHAAGEIITATLVYLMFLQAPWALRRRARPTRAGRAALAGWLGFRVALAGRRSGRTAGTATLAAAGDRAIAYAAALGAAPDAVAAFSSAADRGHAWSSLRGGWHRVLAGRPRDPYVPGVPALTLITAFGALFAAADLYVLTSSGLLWAMGFAVFPGCTWWACAIWVYGSAARAARRPELAEFDGQVLKRWTESDGENGTSHCIAIDDGVSERAWSFTVAAGAYAEVRAGMLVHVRADPRRNRLLALSPGGAPGARAAATTPGAGRRT